MFLDAAEQGLDPVDSGPLQRSATKWTDCPASRLSHHDRRCCDLAREWVRAMDFAQLNGAGPLSGPRWLRERYQWGPSTWPLYWCEALDKEQIDCGAHAALAEEVFAARGVTSFRAQFVQQYNREAIEQWRTIWCADESPSHWLDDRCIYHEANAVLVKDNRVKLWDGSASCWVKALQSGGYGSLLSLRILAPEQWKGERTLHWAGHDIPLDEWIDLPTSRAVEQARCPSAGHNFTSPILTLW